MRFDIVIVGCGFAGAATAYHASRIGARSILIIEREPVPGYHASGRNASLVLQAIADPVLRRLTVASRRAYERVGRRIGFEQVGSLLLGTRARLEACRDVELLESIIRQPREVRSRLPVLAGHEFELALETPSDGVMDIAALLQFYLDGARARGVELRLGCELQGVSGGGPFRLETSAGRIEAGCLVDAAGAWAGKVASMAGAATLPLRALKRHLFVLDGGPELARDAPYVWNVERQFYFRVESGGLLLSICDETPSPRLEPVVEPAIEERLAELICRELPRLRAATLRRAWCCFRTKVPDGAVVLGPDPVVSDFFWVAGLGGNGMGASWETGRLAAQGICRGEPMPWDFDPRRITRGPKVEAALRVDRDRTKGPR